MGNVDSSRHSLRARRPQRAVREGRNPARRKLAKESWPRRL